MDKILKSIKEILLIVGIFVLAWFIVTTVRSCDNQEPGETEYITVTDTSVVILTDTLYLKDPSWEDAQHIASGTASTAEGDTANIQIVYNPQTGQIGVGGHINYHPITEGNFTISLPVIEYKTMEQFSDVAVIFNPVSLNDDDGMSAGVSYEPIDFDDGKIRVGLQALVSIEDRDWASIGIRGAYRWRNVSVGAHVSYKVEFDDDPSGLTFGPNVGVYF